MRITTSQLYENSLKGILDTQKKLVRSQNVLVEQTNLLKPSDDPAAATKVVRMDEDLARLEQFQKNSILLENNLSNQEVVLSNIHTSMQRARNLAIQASNGAMNEQDRSAIAVEIEQIRDELVDLYNSKNGQGDYIFVGSKSGEPPFIESGASGYTYQGDEKINQIQVSETLKIDTGVPGSGFSIFENVNARSSLTIDSAGSTASGSYAIKTTDKFEDFHDNNYVAIPPAAAGSNDFSIVLGAGGTYQVQDNGGTTLESGTLNSDNQLYFQGLEFEVTGNAGDQLDFTLDTPNKSNALNALTSFVESLRAAEIPDDALYNSVDEILFSLDSSMQQVSASRSELGGRLNVLSSVELSNADQELNLKEAKAKISEVDFAEAISDLQKHETALTAANQVFSKVTSISLLNFIR